MEKAKSSRNFLHVIFASGCFSMTIFMCHPQVLLCTAMVVFFYILYQTACADTHRPIVFLWGVLVLVFGVLLGAMQLLPAKELAGLSYRPVGALDHSMISLTSFKLKYIFLFLFPYFFGSHNPGFYTLSYGAASPFPYFFEGVCYMGILPLLLAGTAVLKRTRADRIILFWLCIAIVAFVILLGNNTPLFPIIFKTFFLARLYNISITMYVLNFSFAILAGLGLEYFLRSRKTKSGKNLFIYIAATLLPIPVIVCLVLAAFGGSMAGHGGNLFGMLPALTRPAIYVPVLCMAASGLVFSFLFVRPANKGVQIVLIFILFLDLFFFGHFLHQRSINVDAFVDKAAYPSTVQYLQRIEPDPHAYRVFPVVSALAEIRSYDFIFSNLNILFPVSSVTGYDPLYLQNHYRLLNAERNGTFKDPVALASNNRIISLLNVKYLLALPQYKAALDAMRARAIPGSSRLLPLVGGSPKPATANGKTVQLYTKVFTSPSGVTMYRNRNALPRAYLVEKVRPVAGFEEARHILRNAGEFFDLGREALVEGLGKDASTDLKNGTATVISYKAQEVVIKTQSDGNSFLVLSDSYYPGWQAFTDGKRARIYKTNGIVRGLFVGPGSHEVRFVYSPRSFKVGALISFTTALMLAIVAIALLRARARTS